MRLYRLIIAVLALPLLWSCNPNDYTAVKSNLTTEEKDSIRQESVRLRTEGRIMREKSDFSNALEYQTKALELSLQLGDTLSFIQDYNQLGTTFRRLGRLEQALNNHYLALNYAGQYHPDTSDEALKNLVVSCNGLGNVYLTMGDDTKAEQYFRRALAGEKKLESLLGLAINYANLGSIFEKRQQLDSARLYYNLSMDMNRQLGSEVGMSLCLVHTGRLYQKTDSVALAEQNFREAVSIMKDNEDRYHTFEALEALSRNLLKQGKYADSEEYAEQALKIAKDLNSFECLRNAYLLKGELCESKNDLKNTLDYYKLAKQWSDSVDNPVNDSKLREACINYEIQNSKNQLQALQNAYEANERMHVLISWGEFAMMIILLVVMALLLYASRNRKDRIEALNRLDSMRTTFFRNLTHEFRTPLTVIMGLAEELKNDDIKQEQRIHLLNSIGKQGRSLLELVNELLSISKMMAGYGQCEWRHGDIVPFLRMTLTSYTDYARMRNVELQFVTKQEHIEMDFVPEYYQKIISNLVGNSFKHTPSGGSITINLNLRAEHLLLDITDTGEGISLEDMPHIFELFYQGHSSAKQGSTGIGLPYVQQMVKQMGGIISAENNVQRGTTMHIVISTKCNNEEVTDIKPWTINDAYHDMARVKNTVTNEESETTAESNLPLVLIVEDNPDISDYMTLLLQSRYRIIKAGDAYEALRVVGNQLPDIILTDLMMPGMDGYDLCHSIRQSPILSDVPIVIISARSEDKDRVRGYEDGADAYLLKPFNPAELHAIITRLLSQRRQQRQRLQDIINKREKPWKPDSHKETTEKTDSPEDAEQFLNQVCDIVQKQMLVGDLQIDTIAGILCMSRSTFARRIKEITGSSPSAFILQLRLDHACKLLRETNLSISEISLSCGFDDMSYFSRVFKQNFDITPSQFRQQGNSNS